MKNFILVMIMSFFMCGIIFGSSASEQLILDSSGKLDHEKLKQFNVPAAVISTLESCIESTKNGCSDIFGITLDNLSSFLRKIEDTYTINIFTGTSNPFKNRAIRVIENGQIVEDMWHVNICSNSESELYTEQKSFYPKNGKWLLQRFKTYYIASIKNGSGIDSVERAILVVPAYKDCGTLDYNVVIIRDGGDVHNTVVYQCPIGCYYQDLYNKDHTELHEWLQEKIDSRQKNGTVVDGDHVGMNLGNKDNTQKSAEKIDSSKKSTVVKDDQVGMCSKGITTPPKKVLDNSSLLSRIHALVPMKYIGGAVVIGGILYCGAKWYKGSFSAKKSEKKLNVGLK